MSGFVLYEDNKERCSVTIAYVVACERAGGGEALIQKMSFHHQDPSLFE